MFLTRRKSTIISRVEDVRGKKQSVDGVKHENADHSASGVSTANDTSGVERASSVSGVERTDGGVDNYCLRIL